MPNISNFRNILIKTLLYIAFIVVLLSLFVLIINVNMVANTNDRIISIDNLENSEEYDCILILGAGIRQDGSATPMLRDRLITGISAYNHLENVPIFLSGDSENSNYKETVTMRNYLIENGINEADIICDGYGLSTYESIWRAKNVYGYKRILIVSQKYHLHRAIHIAHELGVEAYGLDAALQGYAKQPIYNLREYLARIKDMIYSEMQPNPKYSDKWEGGYE